MHAEVAPAKIRTRWQPPRILTITMQQVLEYLELILIAVGILVVLGFFAVSVTSHCGRPQLQQHHHGAMHQVRRRINQPCNLLLIQYGRQPPLTLGKWDVIWKVYGRQSVLMKRKRSAAVRPSMVPGESLRSRNRYAWYWRITRGPSRSGERWKYFAKSSTAKMYERIVL